MSWVQLEVFCRLHKSSLTMSCRNLQNPRRKRLQGPSGEDNYGAPDRFSLTDLAVPGAFVNQEGDAADVRYLKNGAAKAIRTLRAAAAAAPTDRVIGLSPLQIQRRFTAAARAAGIEARLTAHSGRVGLASELTARGASTTEVMLAGNWKTARMVAHYSAGATAERGAVRKYL